jgi:hypothetical protein
MVVEITALIRPAYAKARGTLITTIPWQFHLQLNRTALCCPACGEDDKLGTDEMNVSFGLPALAGLAALVMLMGLMAAPPETERVEMEP